MRPAVRGMCTLEGMLDGTLDLEILAMANDYIDAVEENEARAEQAYQDYKE